MPLRKDGLTLELLEISLLDRLDLYCQIGSFCNPGLTGPLGTCPVLLGPRPLLNLGIINYRTGCLTPGPGQHLPMVGGILRN